MPRDRLAEFQQKAGISYGSIASDEYESDTVWKATGLDQFFKQVANTRGIINHLTSDVERVHHLHSTILSSPTTNEKAKVELDDLVDRIKANSQTVRTQLKDMDTAALATARKDGEESALLKIKRTQHSVLLSQYIDTMNEYQTEQADYMDRCKGRLQRQLEIAGRRYSNSELDEMIEKGKLSAFTQDIVLDTEIAKQALTDVTARYHDIIKLEKSLTELHDLFLDISVLVENQGLKIDTIATHVDNTKYIVNETLVPLNQANEYKRKYWKRRMILAVVCAAILIFLGLIVYDSFRDKK